MRRFTAATATWLALIAAPGHADTYPRQRGVDALHYVFRLSVLTDGASEIRGEATVTVRLQADGVQELFLDLKGPTADGKGMTVSAVTSGGKPVQFTHQNDRLRLPLSAASKKDQEASFTIAYYGAPAGGLRLIANIHGDRTAFSENWSNQARHWLPMIDHPYEKATGEFMVTTSSEYQVIANGALVEEVDLGNGQRRTHWKESTPISSWLYALGVARFAVRHVGDVKGVPLQFWVFPQDVDKGFAMFERDARRSLEFFSEQVGPYAYEKLAHVQAAGLSGATEHASNIFYGEKGVAAGSGPVVHETAHQWFGNAVTERDWDDVWLSEGFATYFTLLYTEHIRGRDAFVEGLKRSRNAVLQLEQKLPNTPVVHRNLDEAKQGVLNQFVYQKGGWTLHMLRGLVGTATFWTGIREYYRRYFNQHATTDDLRRVMEEASGRDLSWFFTQWLNRSGVPKIAGTWRYDPAKKQVIVSLAQTHAGDPFRLPLDVGIAAGSGALPRVERVELSGPTATFMFASDVEPASVVLDPGVWALMDAGPFTKEQ